MTMNRTDQRLMQAFAGETQARARYEIAAREADLQGFDALARLFRYTAGQEKEHGEILWKRLQSLSVTGIEITGTWPVDHGADVLSLLRQARDHEYHEAEIVYPAFASEAAEEGRAGDAALFRALSAIERLHGERFERFARLLEQGALWEGADADIWLCLHCGNVWTGAEPTAICPVCSHGQGGFLRLGDSPFQ